MTVYCQRQVENFLPYIPKETEWFLLAGPADGTEAQDVRRKMPNAAIMGWEPCRRSYNLQLARGFPGLLTAQALWDKPGVEMQLLQPREPDNEDNWDRASSLVRGDHTGETVFTTTLDEASEQFGPFKRAVLWADVEHAELMVLRGAEKLLRSGELLAANLELFDYEEVAVVDFLRPYGLKLVHRWNLNRRGDAHWCNAIFVKE